MSLKRDSNFKLSKQTKTMMSFIKDDVKRAEFKNIMIEAELAAKFRPREKKNRNDSDTE